jgi:two-component system nitrate/nitrite response regulator NarL
MLVDDHALVRAALRQALSAPDIEVVAAVASAEEALRVAPDVRPDLLLLDIDLPGMSGLQLLRELGPRLPGTRIVMLTVSTAHRDLFEAMRNGAAGYLTKDVLPEALLRAVRGALQGDLAMPRRMAATVVHQFAAAARNATPEASPHFGSLSARELEVLRLLADGLTDRQIATALTLSVRTVETHVANILRKLEVRNRAQAAGLFRSAS